MLLKSLTIIFKIFTLPLWYLLRLFPRNKKIWIFGYRAGNDYGDNAKALYEYVLANEKEYNPIWITRNIRIFHKLKGDGYPVAKTNSIKGIYYCLRAGVVFINNHPKDVNAIAINGAIQVWLWHGLMMKKIGYDAKRFRWKKKSFFDKLEYKVTRIIFPEYTFNPDYVINTSAFFTPFFCSAFKLEPHKVFISGYPRNDILFRHEKESFINKLNRKFNNPLKVFYMPTWRDVLIKKGMSFNPFNDYGFSIKEFLEVLEDNNIVFINKGHDFDKENTELNNLSERIINLKEGHYSELYLLLKDVDLLITDYSSVYFDFLLLKKPIILAPFDFEYYTKYSRPLYYDYFTEIEGAKALDWSELFEVLRKKKYYTPSQEVVEKFHKFCDGNSSKRICELVKTI